jgi:hypothetical protein
MINQKQSIQYNSEGSFEDWAYGASTFEINNNRNCLSMTSPYNENMVNVDDKSNRAFALRFNSGFLAGRNMFMGNMQAVISKQGYESRSGLMTRNLHMLKQVVEVVQPVYHIRQIWTTISEDFRKTKKGISVYMTVKGCAVINNVQLIQPVPLNQSLEIEPIKSAITSNEFDVRINITFNSSYKQINEAIDLIFEIKCDQEYVTEIEKYGSPKSHLFRAKQNQLYEIRRGKMVYTNKGNDRVIIHGFIFDKYKNNINMITFQKKYNEMEIIPVKNFQIKIGNKAAFVIKYISGSMFKLELLPDSGINIDPKKKLLLTVYSSSNYYYNFKDNSVLKKNWKELKKPMKEIEEEIKPKKSIKNDIQPQKGFTFFLNETININSNVISGFLGNRVNLHYEDSPFEGINQGLVIIPEDAIDLDLRGLLVDNGGASCMSDSPFSFVSKSDDVDEFRMFLKQKDEKVLISIQVKMSSPPSDIFFKWKDKKLEIAQDSVNDEGYTVYVEEVDRIDYPIIGTFVTLEDDDAEVLFKCYVETSLRSSNAKSMKEEFNEFDQMRKDYILNEKKMLDNMNSAGWVWIVVGVVVAVVLFVGGFFLFKFAIKIEGRGEVEEELTKDPHVQEKKENVVDVEK